jgi:uncharacterized protein with HEPN domain
MKKDPLIFLQHILESINIIEMHLQGVTEEHFYTYIDRQDAVAKRLELIGEVVKNLPNEFREKHSDVPWKSIAGLRDIIVHQYLGINFSRIWDMVVDELPTFKKQIEQLIQEYSPKDE